MNTVLAAFVGLVALVWGLDLAASGLGPGSLPWVLRAQGLLLTGLLSIALMSLAMVLATRPAWLERPLGGMDRAYRLHKWAGILGATLAAAHWLVELSGSLIKAMVGRAGRPPKMQLDGLLQVLRDAGKELGEFAVYLVLAMVLLALWKRFSYRLWRHLHRAMPVLYLVLAFHAAVLAPPEWWRRPTGVLLAALLAAGSVSAAVSLSGRIGRSRRVHGRVVAVNRVADDVTEVVCGLDGDWRGHRAGQFVFVTFDRFEGAHPFTIAGADRGDRTVTFQIKALGDYTRELPQRLAVGQSVIVEGPYGRFRLDRRDRGARQIWVAGGIGVTPFIAWLAALRADPDDATRADLHYCTRRATDDPFVARLRALCDGLPNVRLHVHDRAGGADLTAGQLVDGYDGTSRAEVWYCGPRGLAEELRRGLARLRPGPMRFHQEAFEMR
jgi:predicted ferric reductase